MHLCRALLMQIVSAPLAVAATNMSACAQTPMSYLQSYGGKADEIARLTWALLVLSIIVVVIIAILTFVGIIVRRTRYHGGGLRHEPVARAPGGLAWITIGVALSVVALIGAMGWTAYTMAAIDRPPREPKITVQVTGHQWWWRLRYMSEDPSQIFETANEIHIPVGEPVRFELKTADVIHSFWAPALGDKTDLIPNQINVTWLEASKPGVYRGQCSEYCGQQHAHMALLVVADAPADFEAWKEVQLRSASQPSGDLERAQTLFVVRCGACHSVRGTLAGGKLGPDLSHLMSRTSIAAGTLSNTIANLSGWIADPQHVKPGNLMPNLDLSAPELAEIRRYLETLK